MTKRIDRHALKVIFNVVGCWRREDLQLAKNELEVHVKERENLFIFRERNLH